ncbi:hypothetical protein KKF34_05575 [Myxococcota bacterium]|nr:hypothetical protein [Myxococcota bacterium]MBU1380156.1 hypothetical protein [Myxococcota bacterium]MBU1496331.1 hypothetical protein [Myxococcota bacterium]
MKIILFSLSILAVSPFLAGCRNPFDDEEVKCLTPIHIYTEKNQCFAERLSEHCVRVSNKDSTYTEKCRINEDGGILYLNQKDPRYIEEDGWYDCSYEGLLATTLDSLKPNQCLLFGDEPLYTWMCVPDENVFLIENVEGNCFAHRALLPQCFIVNTQQGYSEGWQMCYASTGGTIVIHGLSPYDWKTPLGWEECPDNLYLSETPCDDCCLITE